MLTDHTPTQHPDVDSGVPLTGGSAAGQALRAELAKQGIDPESALADANSRAAVASPPPPEGSNAADARAATRKKVSGRARIAVQDSNNVITGKMVDISVTGASVLLDDMLQPKKMCHVTCDVFHEGKRYVFTTQAITVYGVLARGMGFKVGLHFGPRDAETSKTIAALVGP